MIGIGIIGAGRICGAHAAAALALPETRLAGIAEIDAERLAKATERFGCPGFADYREMLASPDVDAVVIALPHWLHHEVSVAASDAGKHVLLEKPMAMTVAECDAMNAAADRSGARLMVAHSQHFFPVNLQARQLLADGVIGDVVMATDTWYKPFHEGVRPPWFMEAGQGGGMWPMNGSHMIDRLTYFLGSDVTAVKAKVGNPIFGYAATDMGAAFLDFASGISAQIMHAGYRDGVQRFEAEFTGTQAQLRVGGRELWIGREGKWQDVPVESPVMTLRDDATLASPTFALQMREFALAITEGREPAVSGRYGRQVVRVLEACEESSRTGREVRLDG